MMMHVQRIMAYPIFAMMMHAQRSSCCLCQPAL